MKYYYKRNMIYATTLASMVSTTAAYADTFPYPAPHMRDSFHRAADPLCHFDVFRDDYLSSMANHSLTAQDFAVNIIDLAHVAFPQGSTDQNVTVATLDNFIAMQTMLTRLDCYETDGWKGDGVLGSETQAAIASFAHSYNDKYPQLSDAVLYDNDHVIRGVKPVFMEALALESAKDLAYKAELFRVANTSTDGLNRHSYQLALYQAMKGESKYVPFPLNEEDIDVVARTVYGEARGEEKEGQIGVIYSMINRSLSHLINPDGTPVFFKPTVQETVLYDWQYSTWNDGDPNNDIIENLDVEGDRAADLEFRETKELVKDVFYGNIPDPTNGADHYHVTGMSKDWSNGKKPVAVIDGHEFFNLYSEEVTEMRDETADVMPILDAMHGLHQTSLQPDPQFWRFASLNLNQ